MRVTQPSTQPSRQAPDFQRLLQAELVARARANPRYSLRAFARHLGVQPSFLSKLLKGERRVTETTVRRFGARLGLGPTEMRRYAKLAEHGRDPLLARSASDEADYQQLAYDHLQVIADWYHTAILSLATTQGFDPSPKWIARVLGISVNEVHPAIERLERLGFIRIETDGRWVVLSPSTTSLPADYTAAALRKFQIQVLEGAVEALDLPIELRDHSSMTMAVSSSLLPEAKKMIRAFRRKLCRFLEETDERRDAVYQLSVALYPVARVPKARKKGSHDNAH